MALFLRAANVHSRLPPDRVTSTQFTVVNLLN